jgi:transcriptional regulator with XRE-family HTH domain
MAAKLSPQERLARRIREIRKAKGMSQMDLVRDHEWTLSHFQKIERGTLDPRFSTLLKLADCFGVTVAELLEGV